MGAMEGQGPATVQMRKSIKIGRPGYKVVKQRDPTTGQRSLLFEISYPEIEKGYQPRHRFMSAFEQRVERPDTKYQCVALPADPRLARGGGGCSEAANSPGAPPASPRYILFAAEPYETIGFKVPNKRIDKGEGKFYTHWDKDNKIFTVRPRDAQLPAAPCLPASQSRPPRSSSSSSSTRTTCPPTPPPCPRSSPCRSLNTSSGRRGVAARRCCPDPGSERGRKLASVRGPAPGPCVRQPGGPTARRRTHDSSFSACARSSKRRSGPPRALASTCDA